jgi:hypothetical protein
MNAVVVRADHGRVIVQVQPNTAPAQADMPLAFYGPDRAVVTDGTDRDQSVEFIRAGGQVRWIRLTGRIAVRQ